MSAAIFCTAATARAQSDDCAGATAVVTGTNAAGNNCGATNPNDDEASCQASSGLDVFFVWTADCSGIATIDTEGSMFATVNDTVLSVYDACGGTEIACDDDGSTGPSTLLSVVEFNCTSGVDYIIRVAGYNASGSIRCGDITLNIACAAGGSGACCLASGAGCIDVTNGVDECNGFGGTYQGDFTDCASTVCPGDGACCLGVGGCTDVLNGTIECDALSGIYQGDGTDCSSAFCPGPCTTCDTPINAFPYTEDFEGGFGLWTQNAGDDEDWTRNSGGTTSSDTGPTADHTLGTSSGFYLYTEASGFSTGDRYILDGPCFDFTSVTSPAFRFWYHMRNDDAPGNMGTLSVEVSTDACLSYTEVFSRTDDQGSEWLFEQIDLSAYAGQQVNIRFVGTRGNDYESDMAIDDISAGEALAITGACCLGGGMCNDLSESACATAGGFYLGNLTACGVDACPPDGDSCADAVAVGSGTTILSNLGNLVDDPDPSCTTSGAADVWAVYTVEANGSLLIDTCGTFNDVNNPTSIDTILAAYDGSCGGPGLDCDDDCSSTTDDPGQSTCFGVDQTGSNGTRDSCICIDNVTIGQMIFIQIQDFSGNDFGDITLNITPNGCPPPTGRCCLTDGTCQILNETDCGTAGGAYGGDGTDCTESCFGACCLPGTGCSVETELACVNAGGTYNGDASECFTYDIGTGTSNGGFICEGSCADLTILRNSPGQAANIDILFNNDAATADEPSGSCGGSAPNGNLHNDALFRYLAISDANGACDLTITATPTAYDAVLIIRTGNCDGTEIACSDSGISGDAESVTIPSFGPGQLYIQVGDFGGTEGGGLTQLEITCSNASGACCLGGGCEVLTLGNCSLAGGVYKGDGTDCLSSCFGGCCLPNGTCDTLTETSCNAESGTYQGDGASCSPNPCPQPPANDDCVNAIEITVGTAVFGNNCLSSPIDDAEASCQSNSNKDVWYRWTATCTGEATIDTEGSLFGTTSNDTVLSVFDSCGGTELACDDDDGSGVLSSLTLDVTAGVEYFIRVAGYDNRCGEVHINIACAAQCASCPGDVNGDTIVNGLDIQAFTNCYLADFGGSPSAMCACADLTDDALIDELDVTAFVDEILNGQGLCGGGSCCYLDGGSPACAVTNANGCSTLGGIFTLGADCSGDPCPTGRCCTNAGATCADVTQVECDAAGGDFTGGADCLNDPCPTPILNDDCDGLITAFDGATPIDLTGATNSGYLACGDFSLSPDQVQSDLFYEYVASCTGTLFVDTCGNSFDARLAIYDVDCAAIMGGALPVECNDDHGNTGEADTGNVCPNTLSSSFSLPVTAGTTYIIRVGSYATPPVTGMFNLNIACTP